MTTRKARASSSRRASALQPFVRTLTARYGTSQAVADAIGMSLSAFSRGVRLQGTLSVEHCLQLAEAAGVDPDRVLRLAGKPRVADLLARLYGTPRAPLSAEARALVALEPAVQRHVIGLVRGLAGTPSRNGRGG